MGKISNYLIENIYKVFFASIILAILAVQISRYIKVKNNQKVEQFYKQLQEDNNIILSDLQLQVNKIAEKLHPKTDQTEQKEATIVKIEPKNE